jgi:uncharacterized phage-associated protein
MRMVNKKFGYCKCCKRSHKVGEVIELRGICQNHISDGNKAYDLKVHNLSSVQGISACESCTLQLAKMTKQEDPWITEMKDGGIL